MTLSLAILYCVSATLGALYVFTASIPIPSNDLDPEQVRRKSIFMQIGIWMRVVFVGAYLGMLLLYLPTIHFILNVVVFLSTLVAIVWYRLARVHNGAG